jgi:hypothetical protein
METHSTKAEESLAKLKESALKRNIDTACIAFMALDTCSTSSPVRNCDAGTFSLSQFVKEEAIP